MTNCLITNQLSSPMLADESSTTTMSLRQWPSTAIDKKKDSETICYSTLELANDPLFLLR